MARETQAERIIDALIERMNDHTKAVLNRSEGTEFEFGRVCGLHQGLRTAHEIACQIVGEDK
jgi:hypothetical protein